MKTAIYDKTTGEVKAYTAEPQDHNVVMKNWDNVDYIEIAAFPVPIWKYKVDTGTKTLVEQ